MVKNMMDAIPRKNVDIDAFGIKGDNNGINLSA